MLAPVRSSARWPVHPVPPCVANRLGQGSSNVSIGRLSQDGLRPEGRTDSELRALVCSGCVESIGCVAVHPPPWSTTAATSGTASSNAGALRAAALYGPKWVTARRETWNDRPMSRRRVMEPQVTGADRRGSWSVGTTRAAAASAVAPASARMDLGPGVGEPSQMVRNPESREVHVRSLTAMGPHLPASMAADS